MSSSVSGYNSIKGPNGEEYQIPQFTQTTKLSPEQQNLLNVQQGVQQQMLNLSSQRGVALDKTLSQGINQPGYQQFQGGPQLQTSIDGGGYIQDQIAGAGPIQQNLTNTDDWQRVQSVEDAMFQRYNPQLEQDRQRMEQRLADQGIRAGSTAWNTAMDAQARNVNDARLGITINAGQEQNRLQQLALNSGNFANAAQAQQYGQNANNAAFANSAQAQRYGQNANNAAFGNTANQAMWQNQFNTTQANNGLQDSQFANQLATRNQMLNEQAALMNGQQVGMPQFGGAPQTSVGGTDVGSLVNQQYQNQYQQYNDLWGGIGGIAKSVFSLSDRRAKTDIKKLGPLGKGINAYAYRYKGDDTPQLGVMAQEVEKVIPDAVQQRPDGFKEVNYNRVFGALGRGK